MTNETTSHKELPEGGQAMTDLPQSIRTVLAVASRSPASLSRVWQRYVQLVQGRGLRNCISPRGVTVQSRRSGPGVLHINRCTSINKSSVPSARTTQDCLATFNRLRHVRSVCGPDRCSSDGSLTTRGRLVAMGASCIPHGLLGSRRSLSSRVARVRSCRPTES